MMIWPFGICSLKRCTRSASVQDLPVPVLPRTAKCLDNMPSVRIEALTV